MKAVVFKSKFQGMFGKFHFRDCAYIATNEEEVRQLKEIGFFKKGTIWVEEEVEVLMDEQKEILSVRAELDKLNIKYSGNAKLETLKEKLADAKAKADAALKSGAKGTS